MNIPDETIEIKEIAPYSIRKRVPPPLLHWSDLERNDNPLKLHFSKDLIWAIASGLPKGIGGTTDLPLLGSWTAFNEIVTDVTTFKSIINYMPTIPEAPDYKVCKEYLDFVVNTFDILEIPCGFVHADEQVYSRLLHLTHFSPVSHFDTGLKWVNMEAKGSTCKCYTNIRRVPSAKSYTENTIQTPSVYEVQRQVC